MHTTLDPYNTTEEVELTFNNLNSDWTNGQFKILADEMNLFVRTASKYGSDFMFQILSDFLTREKLVQKWQEPKAEQL